MVAGSLTYDTKLDSKGFDKGLSKLQNVAKQGMKAIGIGVGAITTAFAGVVTASVKARGEIEQSLGGVETLFKENADMVIQNANRAYKTAGMSANEYMQNVTSFSASLLQSTAGDTKKAAEIADMAMIDMSDNANKMGTDMEMIKNAYQGFAKQNYTMLDNLKLGYGGTKKEMERLLKDAQKVTGIKYDINNLKDVYEAIHVIQGELDITGTTAKESAETLEGSLSSFKSSWENFLSGSGNLEQVTESLEIFIENVIRIISEATPSIIENLTNSFPRLLEIGGQLLQQIATGIITNLPKILQTGTEVIKKLIDGIVQQLPTLIPQIVDIIILIAETLIDNIDFIIDAGIQLILALADGLIEALPRLIEKAPEIIQKLVDALIRNFPKIVRTGGELIGKLVAGITGSFWKLLEKAPEIVRTLADGIKSMWYEIKNTGRYLIEGLWNGISGMGSWLRNKIKSFAKNIVNNMKSALGIHSPSRVFKDQVGKWIPKGVAVGIDANTNDALNSIDKMNDEIESKMKEAVFTEQGRLGSNASVRANNTLSNAVTLTSKINGIVEIEGKTAGRLLAPYVTQTYRKAGAY